LWPQLHQWLSRLPQVLKLKILRPLFNDIYYLDRKRVWIGLGKSAILYIFFDPSYGFDAVPFVGSMHRDLTDVGCRMRRAPPKSRKKNHNPNRRLAFKRFMPRAWLRKSRGRASRFAK